MSDHETPRSRFVRLAESRVDKALKAINVIGNLSNRNRYDYESEDIRRISRALRKEIRLLEERFSGGDPSEKKFRLE